MRKSMFWVSTILGSGLAGSQTMLAQQSSALDGVWQGECNSPRLYDERSGQDRWLSADVPP